VTATTAAYLVPKVVLMILLSVAICCERRTLVP
jgi:hypothetical protein